MRDTAVAKIWGAKVKGDWLGVLALGKQVEGDLNVVYNDAVERHVRFNMGLAYQNLGQAQPAMRAFQRAADISATERNFKLEGHYLTYVANISMRLGSADARACFEKVRRLGEQGGYFALESEASLGLSKLAAAEGRLEEARELGQQAVIAAGLMEDDELGKTIFQANALQSVVEGSNREAPDFDEGLLQR
jgi:tetratricopeptide (TPR) repeat protein